MFCMVDCIAEVVNLISMDVGNERAKPESEPQGVCKRHIATHRGYSGPKDFYFEIEAPYNTLVLNMIEYNSGGNHEDLKQQLATFNLSGNTQSAIAFATEAIIKYK